MTAAAQLALLFAKHVLKFGRCLHQWCGEKWKDSRWQIGSMKRDMGWPVQYYILSFPGCSGCYEEDALEISWVRWKVWGWIRTQRAFLIDQLIGKTLNLLIKCLRVLFIFFSTWKKVVTQKKVKGWGNTGGEKEGTKQKGTVKDLNIVLLETLLTNIQGTNLCYKFYTTLLLSLQFFCR